jgi:hypothetical protein
MVMSVGLQPDSTFLVAYVGVQPDSTALVM